VEGKNIYPCKNIFKNGVFTLLVAPPASGKTSLLLDLFREGGRFVYFSPLRALTDEFYQRANEYITTCSPREKDKFSSFLNGANGLVVSTSEEWNFFVRGNAWELSSIDLVIFDEIHLFFYWGHTFRPVLFESLLEWGLAPFPLLGLTATFGRALFEEWRDSFTLSRENLYFIDFGNQKLKCRPEIFWYPKILRNLFWQRFEEAVLNPDLFEKILCFLPYREMVDRWALELEIRSIPAVGFKGGEGGEVGERFLKRQNEIKCLFSTTVLSHGVNLPPFSKIFIGFHIAEPDFWIQMVGRGGRDGRPFQVFTFDCYFLTWKEKIKSLLRVFLYAIKDIFI
jgi:ATP-dependent DNA helicase RecQ